MNRLLIVGAGGHGRAVAEAVLMAGSYELTGFVDDGWPEPDAVWGYPVLGSTESLADCRSRAEFAFVAIGNNRIREALHGRVRDAGFELATIVHPRAFVSPRATISNGCAVMARAVVGTEAFLGEGAIVNCGAVVDHHCRVDSFGHLGVAACMAGGAKIGPRAWIQAGAALGYRVHVAADEVMAPGAARQV